MSPEEEEMEKKRNHIKNSLELTAQSALLDFHSDRAVAHASFLVASVFGLVTLLAIVQQMITGTSTELILCSLIPFWAFSYLGFWSLQRFGKYAFQADRLQLNIQTYLSIETKKKTAIKVNGVLDKTKRQLAAKILLQKLNVKGDPIALYLAYFLLMVFTSCIVYLQSADFFVHLLWFTAIAILGIAIILPPIIYPTYPTKEAHQ